MHPTNLKRLAIAAVSALATISACSTSDEDISDGQAPTWFQDVQPIVAGHCQQCHHEGGVSFSLENVDVVRAMAPLALDKIRGDDLAPNFMPPFGARDTDECTPPLPWKNDTRLSSEQIATFAAWLDAGMPAGDAATAAPLPEAPDTSLHGDVATLRPVKSFNVPPGTTEDIYQCFALDSGRSAESWITGMQVKPGNAAVVHHVVLFSDPNGEARELDPEGEGFSCFGIPQVSDTSVLFAWTPGGKALELPGGAGMHVPSGGGLVMQVHYHSVGGLPASDHTEVDVRWVDQKPDKTAEFIVYGALDRSPDAVLDEPPFFIPAGAGAHRETMRYPIDIPPNADVRIWAVFPHMHFLGRDLLATMTSANGDETCLVHTPKWDFDWQQSYMYDVPIEQMPRVRDGDELMLRCTYDNTVESDGFQRIAAETGVDVPFDVNVGEGTLDEMCLAIVGVLY